MGGVGVVGVKDKAEVTLVVRVPPVPPVPPVPHLSNKEARLLPRLLVLLLRRKPFIQGSVRTCRTGRTTKPLQRQSTDR